MERLSVFGSVLLVLGVLVACKGSENKATPVASASAVVETKPTELTFVASVPKPGTKLEQAMKTAFKFTYAGTVSREETETEATIDVQASDEFRVTKAAIDVKKLTTTKQDGTEAEKRTVSPIAGSRYVVSRTDDGTVSALSSSGLPVAATMLTAIKENFGDVVDRDKSRAFLPKRPVKIGEKLIPAADVVLAIIGQKDDGTATVDGVEFILQSGTSDKAIFNVSMTFTIKADPKLRMRAKLEGTIDVRPKDAMITSVSLKGPLTLLDPGGNEKGTGDLSFTGTETSL